MINKLKTYMIVLLTTLLTYLGIIRLWFNKQKKQSDLNKTNKDIDTNDKKINYADKQIEEVKTKKTEIATNIIDKEKQIAELKQEINEVSPEPITDVVEAKENIIKKTKRRGRRPNKNNKPTTTKTSK